MHEGRHEVPGRRAGRLAVFVGFYALFALAVVSSHRRVAAAPSLRVEPALCRVLARPDWLTPAEVETIRQASGLLRESIPIYGPGVPERLAKAHEASPWVKRVKDVRLFHPDRAVIAIELRKPLAGLLLDGRDIALVDEEGIRLPGLYRRPPEGLGYPLRRIDGAAGPVPAPGRVWSAAVREGTAVAGELLALPPALAAALSILAIDVSAVEQGGPVRLTTATGAVVEWGRSRSHEFGALGPGLADKIRKLERTLVVHPALTGVHRVKLQFPDLVVEQVARPRDI